MKRLIFSLWMGLALLVGLVSPAKADGIIIPPPPCLRNDCPQPPPRPMQQLDIRYHHVNVRINDQLAVTHVDQAFHNPNSYPIEGTYIFPLPVDAVVTNFTLWVDGKPVEGKVLSAEEARRTYEDTVRQLKDPALLEYIGRGAVQASIFPIPPDGERRIELEYSQALTADNGLVNYSYPLNTEKFSSQALENVTIKVEISASQSIRAVYSSSHSVDIQRQDDQHLSVSYEANDVRPDSDFNLYYSIGQSEAFHLFSYRDPGDPADKDGFFLLLLAPKPGQEVIHPIPKDVLLVLDHSGSMEGEKFQQAQSALRYILQHLNPGDRFHITAFSTGIEMYANDLRPTSEVQPALDWVNGLSAQGSTDINRALLETASVADRERSTYLIFLTDGLPTEGVTESQEILNNFSSVARSNLRLFAFGVGYDVDTFLLDSLAQEHHGLSTYVQPGQSLDEALSSFYTRISTPVLTNLKLDFGNQVVYDVYPDPLPDLFSGNQIVVTGRYREGGQTDASLYGDINGIRQVFRYPDQAFVQDSRSIRNAPVGLPRLWATRKIGYLLNQVRLKGNNKELIDQIVRLSIRYGIVTPYSSYLVTEPMPLGSGAQGRVAQDQFNQMQAQPTEAAFGAPAVQKAAEQGALSRADVAAGISPEAEQKVKVVGARTFVLNEGVWMDTTYDPDTMEPVQVAFLSADYFKLAGTSPEIAAALSLADQVIVVMDGKAYQVVSEGSQAAPLVLPTAVEPLPTARVTTGIPSPTPQTGKVTPSPYVQYPTNTSTPRGNGFTPGLVVFPCLAGLVILFIAFWAFQKR